MALHIEAPLVRAFALREGEVTYTTIAGDLGASEAVNTMETDRRGDLGIACQRNEGVEVGVAEK